MSLSWDQNSPSDYRILFILLMLYFIDSDVLPLPVSSVICLQGLAASHKGLLTCLHQYPSKESQRLINAGTGKDFTRHNGIDWKIKTMNKSRPFYDACGEINHNNITDKKKATERNRTLHIIT